MTSFKCNAAMAFVLLLTVHAAGTAPIPGRPPNSEQPRTDIYGDPLPPGAIARLGTVRFRTPGEAVSLALAPDGKTVAVNSYGGLYLFEAGSGKRIKRLGKYFYRGQQRNNDLVFSPDSERLAAKGHAFVTDKNGRRRRKAVVRFWNLKDKTTLQEYDADHMIWLGWSAKGQPLAVCLEEDQIRLRELLSGRSQIFKCKDLRRPQLSEYVDCSFAQKGRTLAVADEQGRIHVWNTGNGKKRCIVPVKQNSYMRALALSPDGRRLATLNQDRTTSQNVVQILDALTGRLLRTIAGDHKNVTTFRFTSDGKKIATAGWSGIRSWDVATGKELSRSEGEGANTVIAAFSGNGKTLATLQRHSPAFHIWDVATGNRKSAPVGHTGRPYGTSFSPDGRRMASAGAGDGTIHVWDLATSKSLFNIRRGRTVRRVAYSRDGRSLFSTWTDQELWISDASNGKRRHVIRLEDPKRPNTYQSAISMSLSANGKTLVALSYHYPKKNGVGINYWDTLITGWDPTTRKLLLRRRLAGREPHAISADTRLLAVAQNNSELKMAPGKGPMRLEDLATGELLLMFPGVGGQTWPMEFSPDGRTLAAWNTNYKLRKEGDPTKTGQSLCLCEVATGAEVLSLPMYGQPRAAFSSDNRLLAVPAPKNEILVWDLAGGRELRRFKDFGAEVTWLTFTPDGRRLVSGLADSTLLIWNAGSPSPLSDKFTAAKLAKAWADLAGTDAPRAYRARWALAGAPKTFLPMIEKHVKPAQPADQRQLRKLLKDLDSEKFAVRASAQEELEKLGELAAPALRKALANKPTLEVSLRVKGLLKKLRGPVTRAERLMELRAVAVLEDIATPEARTLLAALAKGAPAARLTKEARAALRRLQQKGGSPNP